MSSRTDFGVAPKPQKEKLIISQFILFFFFFFLNKYFIFLFLKYAKERKQWCKNKKGKPKKKQKQEERKNERKKERKLKDFKKRVKKNEVAYFHGHPIAQQHEQSEHGA
jgi:hypothetical protein